jgi:hypothetical protein
MNEIALRILLTSSGYIGRGMAPMQVRADHEVVGVDTKLYQRSLLRSWDEFIQRKALVTSGYLRPDLRWVQQLLI